MRFAILSLLILSGCSLIEPKPKSKFAPDLYVFACEHGCVWLNDYGQRVPHDDEIILDEYFLMPKSDLLKLQGGR